MLLSGTGWLSEYCFGSVGMTTLATLFHKHFSNVREDFSFIRLAKLQGWREFQKRKGCSNFILCSMRPSNNTLLETPAWEGLKSQSEEYSGYKPAYLMDEGILILLLRLFQIRMLKVAVRWDSDSWIYCGLYSVQSQLQILLGRCRLDVRKISA